MTLVLSGGGVKCISEIGALKYVLEEKKMKFENYISVSAGAILALLIVCDYTPSEIKKFIIQTNIQNILVPWYKILTAPINIFKSKGLFSLNKTINFLKYYIEKKIRIPASELTFNKLYQLTGKNLVILTTSLSIKSTLVLSHETSGDLNIFEALKASIAVPGVFIPTILKIHEESHLCVDGSLLNNTPIIYAHALNQNKTLSLIYNEGELKRLRSIKDNVQDILMIHMNGTFINARDRIPNTTKKSLISYGADIIDSMYLKIEEINSSCKYTIPIKIPSKYMALTFKLSKEEKESLIEIGYNSAVEHLK